MQKLSCFNNGVKPLKFIDSIRHLIFYSTSPLTSIKPNPYFANYLVEHLGFSKQLARSISNKFNQVQSKRIRKVSSSKFVANADSVLAYLRQNGLNDSQIRIVVSSVPNILLSKVEQTLKPKVEYFQNFGFSESDFAQVVSVNPYVLLSVQFIRAIEALKDVMGCDNHVITIMKKSSWNTTSSFSNNLIPNVALLRDYGISTEIIRDRLLVHPYPFLRKTVIFKDLLVRVEKKLGIPRHSSRFLYGLHMLASINEKNIESKIKMFESFGWMRSDVMDLIRANPFSFVLSEARIKKSLEFLMNDLGYEPAYIASHNALIGYSLEKRIMPRNKVLLALKEKGLIKMDHSLYTTLLLSEPRFLKKYVLPFEEVHEVYVKHTGRSPVQPLTEGGAGDKDGL